MNHRISRVAALIILALLTVSCGGPRRVPLRGGTEHLLLLDGRVLQYHEVRDGKTREFTLTLHFNGGTLAREFAAEFRGLKMGACSFISTDTQVIFETMQPFTAMAVLPEYRQVWVDETAQFGDAWQDLDVGTETVFAGLETITVPAGTFADCYKTVTVTLPALQDTLAAWRAGGIINEADYEQMTANAELTIIRWFAAGVGLIKEQIGGSNHVRELTAILATGKGKMDVPLPQAQPTDESHDTLESDDAIPSEP